MMSKKLLLLLSALSLLGCGPMNSLEGGVGGFTLAPKDAVFANLYSDGKITATYLFMADKENLCATLKANRRPKNATALQLFFGRRNGDGVILAPDVGEYPVGNVLPPNSGFDLPGQAQPGGTSTLSPPRAIATGLSAYAAGVFNKTDANCKGILADNNSVTQSGVVKIQEFSAQTNGRLTGTFDITFGTQKDKTKGSFSATYCDVTSLGAQPSCE